MTRVTESDTAVVRYSGELSLRGTPSLEDISRARGEGFARVGLCGLHPLLATREGAEALVGAGATDVHLALHGASAEVHEHVAGEGSFAATMVAVTNARSAGIVVVASTALTRSTARSLGELPKWLMARGAAGWLVEVPRVGEARGPNFDAVYPRLAMGVPYALHALEAARRLGLLAWVRGAPRCLLGPYAPRALPEAPRAYGPMCDACPARARCGGVDAAYLARFAGDELSPARVRTEPAPAVGLREAAVARMFVVPFVVPALAEE